MGDIFFKNSLLGHFVDYREIKICSETVRACSFKIYNLFCGGTMAKGIKLRKLAGGALKTAGTVLLRWDIQVELDGSDKELENYILKNMDLYK